MVYKISELIGKQVITLSDAGRRGVILGAYFDGALTKCKGFTLLSDNDENEFYVDFRGFSALFCDAAVICSSAALKENFDATLAQSPINLPAFNQDGKSKGTIRDINMDGADVVSFLTDSGDEIPAGTLLSRSDDIVVFNDSGTALKIKKTPKKEKTGQSVAGSENAKKGRPAPASQQYDSGDSHAVFDAPQKNQTVQHEKPGIPFGRLRPNNQNFGAEATQNTARQKDIFINKYSFLLGKRLLRSIYTNNGRLIAKENELVTERIIGLAKENGKLAAIALHSL